MNLTRLANSPPQVGQPTSRSWLWHRRCSCYDPLLNLITSESLAPYLELRHGSVPPLTARPAADDVMALQIFSVTLHVPVEVLGIVPPDIRC